MGFYAAPELHAASCHRGPAISWVIAGSESGPGRRETKPEWLRAIKNQCVEAGVPFFLKQAHIGGRKVSMPELDGRTWDQFPARDTIDVANLAAFWWNRLG
jgi:protein gp37